MQAGTGDPVDHLTDNDGRQLSVSIRFLFTLTLETLHDLLRRRKPCIERMAQDMQIRNFAANTIDSYTWHVDKFCCHFDKPPEELGPEQIRLYQLYLVNEKKTSWSSFNQAVCALRFLYASSTKSP